MVVWAGKASEILLLSLVDQLRGKIDHESIAEKIGQGCTPSAVKEHLKKLRRVARNGDNPAPESPGTPKKRKRRDDEEKSPGKSPSKRREKLTIDLEENEEIESDIE